MENNKTNRNKRLAIVAAMVALILLLLCFGGSTFAKYISSKEIDTQSATVAKWGFVVTANADNMFSKEYKNGAIVAAGTEGVDVKADVNTATDIVAPGTEGSMTFSIKGQAEVLSKLTVTASGTDISLTKTAVDGSEDTTAYVYNPIKWTLSEGNTDVVTNDTLDNLVTYLNNISKNYEVNEAVDVTYTIKWKWEFSVDDATDAKDTILGIMSEGTSDEYTEDTGYEAVTKLSFDLKIVVEQIQAPADSSTTD